MRVLVVLCFLAGCLSVPGYAQETLPDFAREERARRDANPIQSIRVYTNENIPRGPGPSPADAVRTSPRVGAPASLDASGTPIQGDASAEDVPGSANRSEEEWRRLFAEARQELERSQNRLALLEVERSDLNRQLLTRDDIYNREYQLRPLIQEKEAQLAAEREHVELSRKAMSDLQEALRRSGAPAGWGRP